MASDKPKTAVPERPRSTETLKVAYAKTGDGVNFADVVVFGTDDARTDFLIANADTWWRIADVAKGQTITEAIAQATPQRALPAKGASNG